MSRMARLRSRAEVAARSVRMARGGAAFFPDDLTKIVGGPRSAPRRRRGLLRPRSPRPRRGSSTSELAMYAIRSLKLVSGHLDVPLGSRGRGSRSLLVFFDHVADAIADLRTPRRPSSRGADNRRWPP